MRSAVFSDLPEKLHVIIVVVFFALLAVIVPRPGYAIQNCHDYTLYTLTHQNGTMTSRETLTGYLESSGYKKTKFSTSSLRPVEPGDVLIFGGRVNHSGVVNAQGTVDHYFQIFESGKTPRASRQIDPEDLDIENAVLKGWTVKQIVSKLNSSENDIEVWRKSRQDTVRFSRSQESFDYNRSFAQTITRYSVKKDAGQVTLRVGREGSGRGSITVRIVPGPDKTLNHESATAGRSYTLVNDSVTWANNDLAEKEVVVKVRDDSLEPGDRGVSFKLQIVSGNSVLGEPSTAVLLITQPYSSTDRNKMGGEISFLHEQVTVDATSKRVRLTVTREGFSKGEVTVGYQSQDGTARSGTDYTPVSGSLTWSDGDKDLQTIDVPLSAGTGSSAGSTFTVSLKNPSAGVQLVRPSTVTVTLPGLPADSGQTAVSPSKNPASQEDEDSSSPAQSTSSPVRRKECRYLKINPDKIEVGSGRQVVFQASAVFDDGSETDVTGSATWQATAGTAAQVSARATWELSPANTYTAPRDLRDNQNVTITARWGACEGTATINALAPSWSPPATSANDRGLSGATLEPWEYTHYVLCDKTGHVVTGKETSPALFGIIEGPFPGPRDAEQWIPKNCPSLLCTIEGTRGICAKEPPVAPTGGDAYFALCDSTGHIVISRSANLQGHIQLANSPRLTGEAGVRFWLQQNCPSWECTSSGACASAGQIRWGGRWAVVCSKANGGMSFTEYPNSVDSWIKVEKLLSDRDAINWIAQNCPSERCDENGRCLPGGKSSGAATHGRPVEAPGGGDSPFDKNYDDFINARNQKDKDRPVQQDTYSDDPEDDGYTSKDLSQTLDKNIKRIITLSTECDSERSCGEGWECRNGKCVKIQVTATAACTKDTDCPAGKSCVNGMCETKQVTASAACTKDQDCPTEKTCVNGKCTKKTTTTATQCTKDKDCPSGQTCVNGKCEKKHTTTSSSGGSGTSTSTTVPSGTYEPKGNGQPCTKLRETIVAQCTKMGQDCTSRNCSNGGYSGCALDCPGCGGTFPDYVSWCTLHPSYEPMLSSGLTTFVGEIKACIDQFLSDGKPGRRERGYECQGKSQKKLADNKATWVQQACQARCTQDGRSGVAVLGGGRHRCECR